MVDQEKFRDYVYDTARCRGIDNNNADDMHELADELMWEWLDIVAERDAGMAVIVEGEWE